MTIIKKPDGGYHIVSLELLCSAWLAYRHGGVSWLGFRVFLALLECEARRAAATRVGNSSCGTLWYKSIVPEIQELVGCARPAQVRASLVHLQKAGLVQARDDAVAVTGAVSMTRDAEIMIRHLGRRGTVPIPRRVLRYLAQQGTVAVTAYMLCAVIRSCRLRARGEFAATGRCSTGLVAQSFDVGHRSVKRAVGIVKAIGWLTKEPELDRWSAMHGPRIEVSTNWTIPSIEMTRGRKANSTRMTPAIEKKKLLSDLENQEPAGVLEGNDQRLPSAVNEPLRRVRRDELQDVRRLRLRFDSAVASGLVEPGQASYLQFLAAAQRATRVGNHNPPGLFVAIVTRELWSYISQTDEERARALLRQEDSQSSATASGCDSRRVRALVDQILNRSSCRFDRVRENASTTQAMFSKNEAASELTPVSNSPAITRSASTTDSTFSMKVDRNAA